MRSRLRASCQASSVSWSLGARVSVKHTSYELHEIRFTVRGCCFRTIPSIVKALIPNRVTVGVDAVHRAGLVGKHIRILIKFKQYVTLFFFRCIFSRNAPASSCETISLDGLQSRRPQILCNLTAIEAMTQSRYAAKL